MEKNHDPRVVVLDVDQYHRLLDQTTPSNLTRAIQKHARTFNSALSLERARDLAISEQFWAGHKAGVLAFFRAVGNKPNAVEVHLSLPRLRPALRISESLHPSEQVYCVGHYSQWTDEHMEDHWVPATLLRVVKMPVNDIGRLVGCQLRLDPNYFDNLDRRYRMLSQYRPIAVAHRDFVREASIKETAPC